jgi:hypothetical protein
MLTINKPHLLADHSTGHHPIPESETECALWLHLEVMYRKLRNRQPHLRNQDVELWFEELYQLAGREVPRCPSP